MKKSLTYNAYLHFGGSVARILLGVVFMFSGFVKAVDPLGTVYKIEDYLKAFGGFFTDLMPLAMVAALVMIAFEWVLGVCLVMNVWTKWTQWLALLFMLVMTPLTLYLAIANPVSDCGCFGDAVVLTNWQTFAKNVVLMLLVIALLILSRYNPNQWNKWVNCGFFSVALVTVFGFMTYNLLHLPVMDFRPYALGNNIPEMMEVPDDAPADEYLVTFIYEKDGQQQEFTLENYPKGDSTWTFVDQKSVLVKKGFEPAIHDFELLLVDEEEGLYDITYDVMEAEEDVMLVVMYDLGKTNTRQAHRLNGLYEEAMAAGMSFYAVTGSGETEIMAFRTMYGAEYPFCVCDPVTLKTVVRANPGVVVLRQGTIVEKYNLRNKK